MWSELGQSPPFRPMRALRLQWSRASSLVCEVALTRSRGIFSNPRNEGAKLGTQYSIIRCPTREPNKYGNPQPQWKSGSQWKPKYSTLPPTWRSSWVPIYVRGLCMTKETRQRGDYWQPCLDTCPMWFMWWFWRQTCLIWTTIAIIWNDIYIWVGMWFNVDLRMDTKSTYGVLRDQTMCSKHANHFRFVG